MVGILKVNVYLHYKDLSPGQLSYVRGKKYVILPLK